MTAEFLLGLGLLGAAIVYALWVSRAARRKGKPAPRRAGTPAEARRADTAGAEASTVSAAFLPRPRQGAPPEGSSAGAEAAELLAELEEAAERAVRVFEEERRRLEALLARAEAVASRIEGADRISNEPVARPEVRTADESPPIARTVRAAPSPPAGPSRPPAAQVPEFTLRYGEYDG